MYMMCGMPSLCYVMNASSGLSMTGSLFACTVPIHLDKTTPRGESLCGGVVGVAAGQDYRSVSMIPASSGWSPLPPMSCPRGLIGTQVRPRGRRPGWVERKQRMAGEASEKDHGSAPVPPQDARVHFQSARGGSLTQAAPRYNGLCWQSSAGMEVQTRLAVANDGRCLIVA